MCFGSTPHRKALPGWWIQTEDHLAGKKALTTMLQNQPPPPKLLVSYLQLNSLFFLQGDQGPAGPPGPKGAPGVGIAGPKVRHAITDKIMIVNRSSESEGLRSGCWRLRRNSVNSV